MDPAKITLSTQEMELVNNADWILTKNAIMMKAKLLLENTQEQFAMHINVVAAHLPAEIFQLNAKVSKGEYYRGLPYLILDYPRFFKKENVCAIRCMFWWGNFFSITLHLSGDFKKRNETKILSSFNLLQQNDFYLSSSSTDEWEHHFENDNYLLLKNINEKEFEQRMVHSPFIKIAKHYPLRLWDNVTVHLQNDFGYLLQFCYA
jgi:hypothetical protein